MSRDTRNHFARDVSASMILNYTDTWRTNDERNCKDPHEDAADKMRPYLINYFESWNECNSTKLGD